MPLQAETRSWSTHMPGPHSHNGKQALCCLHSASEQSCPVLSCKWWCQTKDGCVMISKRTEVFGTSWESGGDPWWEIKRNEWEPFVFLGAQHLPRGWARAGIPIPPLCLQKAFGLHWRGSMCPSIKVEHLQSSPCCQRPSYKACS